MIELAAEDVTAWVTGVVPVPVKELVGELLPLVVLVAVTVEVLAPVALGVKVTL